MGLYESTMPLQGVFCRSLPVLKSLQPVLKSLSLLAGIVGFFAGFCCVANGTYLGLGWLGPHGDCRTIVQHGGQVWPMICFGVVSSAIGFTLWATLDRRSDAPATAGTT